MLRTGAEYLDGLRDGRVVYAGGERVTDVPSNPGFRVAAETMAAIFDLKLDPAQRAHLVVEEGDGAPYAAYYLAPRTHEDLEQRLRCHQLIADATYGLFGRSPDHVASLVTGLTMEAEALDAGGTGGSSLRLLDYHRVARERDIYAAYAVLPNRASFGAHGLRVVHEDDDGVVVHGMKALATAAVLADEIWVGNLQPISEGQEAEAITFVVPCNAPGLQLWSREAFATSATSELDRPLTWRFDEGDAVVSFDHVRINWDRVFVHRDPARCSEIYTQTPAHCLANHQSAVRARSKIRLLVGLAKQIASATGAEEIAVVQETLGRLAACEATIAALVEAQLNDFDRWPSGGVTPNRRYVYAALNWCQESFPVMIESIRELCGSGVFRYPTSAVALETPHTRDALQGLWDVTDDPALQQMQLFKIAWDLIGSEFAGRQQQYERFYAGPPHVVRGHSYREAPWDELEAVVSGLIARPRPR